MITRFYVQVAAFGFFYMLAMMAAFPFLVYFGKPKPWQKGVEFLMSFPVDSGKVGIFSFFGVVAVFFLNGLLWGLALIGIYKLSIFLITKTGNLQS